MLNLVVILSNLRDLYVAYVAYVASGCLEAKLDAFAGRDVVKGVEYVDVPDNTRDSTSEQHAGDVELA